MKRYNKSKANKERTYLQDRYHRAAGSVYKRLGHRLVRKLCRTLPRGKQRRKWERMYRDLHGKNNEHSMRKEGVLH